MTAVVSRLKGIADRGGLPSGTRFEDFDELIGSIYEGPMESPPWNGALQLIRDALNAAHVTLMLRPPSDDSSGVMINTGNVDTQALESYETDFFAQDPFVHLREGEVVSAEELIGKQWLKSPIYTDYFKQLNIRHILGADIYTRDGVECRFRVTRGHDTKAFTKADKALVSILLPHIKRSIQLHTRLDYLECERQLFAGTVNRMLLGIISFDQNREIININQEARRILDEEDGIRLAGNTLRVNLRQESHELQNLIKGALIDKGNDQQPTVAEAMSITRPSGRSNLGILVRSVPMGRWSESKTRPAAVMYLRDPDANVEQPSQDLVRRLFGLTRMEATLALLLTEGNTLDEAAEQMNVRRNTARTHLRSIFCKTGVTRQTMLVRLLLNSVIRLG